MRQVLPELIKQETFIRRSLKCHTHSFNGTVQLIPSALQKQLHAGFSF